MQNVFGIFRKYSKHSKQKQINIHNSAPDINHAKPSKWLKIR